MIIERCDRCGREKHIKMPFGLNTLGDERKEASGSWVKYSITRYVDGEGEMLHLCEDCTKKMDKFMDEVKSAGRTILNMQRMKNDARKKEAQE
jgi:hypothetical protein